MVRVEEGVAAPRLVPGRHRVGEDRGDRLVLLRHLRAGGHVVVHLLLAARGVDLPREALHRAELHAGGLSELAVHVDARRRRARVLGERLVRGELELGHHRGEVHVAELGMEEDVARERPRPEPGELRVELEALEGDPRPLLVVEVGRAVDRRHLEPALDEEGEGVRARVGPRLGGAEIGHRLGRHPPRALGLAADADGDDGADPGHEVGRAVPGGRDPLDGLEVGDADREGAPLPGVGEDLGLGPRRIALRPLNHWRLLSRRTHGGRARGRAGDRSAPDPVPDAGSIPAGRRSVKPAAPLGWPAGPAIGHNHGVCKSGSGGSGLARNVEPGLGALS